MAAMTNDERERLRGELYSLRQWELCGVISREMREEREQAVLDRLMMEGHIVEGVL